MRLSIPIMIGSAAQNLIALADTIFLGRVGDIELGAIGLVGVFYLMITSIGYSFSKAGQIMIARRMGEQKEGDIGAITYSMWAFSMVVATALFFFMKFGSHWFFGMMLDNPLTLQACVEYLDYRAYGIFFSYTGVIILALYTGVARTKVIMYNAVALGLCNVLLNYLLIFGNWGFPAMGMGGAALASTLSEVIAIFVFVVYALMDKPNLQKYGMWGVPKVSMEIIRQQVKLSTPVILQSVVGLGSGFIFFLFVEEIDSEGKALAVSNVLRSVYLVLMIPAWGFGSGINTIVSNFLGKGQQDQVMPAVRRTALMCFLVTMGLSLSLVIAPGFVLRIATDDMLLIGQSQKLIWVLLLILSIFSISAIYFNGLVGTGATRQALILQTFSVVLYLLYVYFIVKIFHLEPRLEWAWMSELFYWLIMLVLSLLYLRSAKWKHIKV